MRTKALGADLTTVKCAGKWLSLGITVDSISGLVLTIDALSGQEIEALKSWIEPIAASVGAELLVTDDADGFKTVADEVGMQHQVCKAHVKRNTEDLIERTLPLVAKDADRSLQAIGVSPEQAIADLKRLGELVKSRQREQASELEAMHRRYRQAHPPKEGEHQTLAYRLRLLFLDRWNLLASLDTLPQLERQPTGRKSMAPTMPVNELLAGGVKERYRSMGGYKVPENALSVSRFLALWQLPQPGWC